MSAVPHLIRAGRVNEPQGAREFSEALSHVAASGQPVIVQRDGADFAAVIPLDHLELQDAFARQEAERLASQIDWDQAVRRSPPAAEWFEGDEPKPF